MGLQLVPPSGRSGETWSPEQRRQLCPASSGLSGVAAPPLHPACGRSRSLGAPGPAGSPEAGDAGASLLGTPSHRILERGLKAQQATEWQEPTQKLRRPGSSSTPDMPLCPPFPQSQAREEEGRELVSEPQGLPPRWEHLLCRGRSDQRPFSGPREAKHLQRVGCAFPGVSGKVALGPLC